MIGPADPVLAESHVFQVTTAADATEALPAMISEVRPAIKSFCIIFPQKRPATGLSDMINKLLVTGEMGIGNKYFA